ncbi:hypothetical protein NONO_c18000 [Nocardia nova SH22a]|uniref:Uncharacterized protein n=1 Tax=Nocardia nova SH22a TaxID=1415166 RepID=W5TB53_9NOCA|nr:hypothetical protein [Nocardia nova]AHH16600.1 hypothetical protein NONO_c18000 [Nocardia nova SH22a]
MWRRRSKPVARPEPEDLRRAREANERADADLAQARAQWGTVNQLHAEYEKVLERNGFGESIEIAFRRKVAGT